MSFFKGFAVLGCLSAFLFVSRSAAGGDLHLSTTLEPDAIASWRANGLDFKKNGHGVWAYLSVTNISQSPVYGARFYAQFLDSSGRECFSLLFSQELTARGEQSELFQPKETRTLLSETGSIFPAVPPATVRVHSLFPLPPGDPTAWLQNDQAIWVPPTINGGGGFAEGENIISGPECQAPYLGFASLVIDSKGSTAESVIVNAVTPELRNKFFRFVKSLPFNPALTDKGPTSSRLFVLFVRLDSKAFSDDSSWLWDAPWVAEAVKKLPESDAVPVVVELAFEPQSGTSADNPGLEYLSVGSDWCGNLFTSTEDPVTGRRVWKWDPGSVSREVQVLPPKKR